MNCHAGDACGVTGFLYDRLTPCAFGAVVWQSRISGGIYCINIYLNTSSSKDFASSPPAVGIFKLVVPAVANALCGKIGRRAKHLFLGQNIRDLVHTLAVNDHTEDAAHNGGSFT